MCPYQSRKPCFERQSTWRIDSKLYRPGNVTPRGIDLSSLNVDGSFPGRQTLSGSLPPSICDLPKLQKLLLQFTGGISGSIPSCIGLTQPALVTLDLEGNELTGPIPESLCSARSLGHLLLYENHLTGNIPECLGSLNLDLLELFTNSLVGTIPNALCAQTKLTLLLLDENRLTGTVPDCLGSLTNLQGLELYSNSLSGRIPQSLCALNETLAHLVFYSNGLSGEIPSCIGRLLMLQDLQLGANSFSGTIPMSICALTGMEFLSLADNRLDGPIPTCLGNMSRLEHLELELNSLTGSISESFCSLHNLGQLMLYSNKLEGSIPNCVAMDLPSLTLLWLQDNQLSGTLPSMWELSSLESVVVSNNAGLRGTLPSSIFHQGMPRNNVLSSIVIEGTRIGGTLPVTCCESAALEVLALSGNILTGSIPACVTTMKRLSTFRASSNSISGILPHSMSNMTSLRVLDLSSNLISGRIPDDFGDLAPHLFKASLQLNRLSCDIPVSTRRWKASPGASVSILPGNLFGCNGGLWSIQDALGLKDANAREFESYSCGGSSYVLSIITLLSLFIPGALVFFKALSCDMKNGYISELRSLGFKVFLVSCIGGMMYVNISFNSKSIYACQYGATATYGNKRGGKMYSFVAGGLVGVALLLTLRERTLNPPRRERQEFETSALRSTKTTDALRSLRVFFCLTCVVVTVLTLNVLYVLVALSEAALALKVLSEAGIVAAKCVTTAFIIPRATRLAAGSFSDTVSDPAMGLRLRLLFSLGLNSISSIIIPVSVVAATDKRCLYYWIMPPKAVSTDVPGIEYCSGIILSTTGPVPAECVDTSQVTVRSVFTPKFQYSGEQCVGAVISIYAPVFLASVLLATVGPAIIDLLIIPSCVRNLKNNSCSIIKGFLPILRLTSAMVPVELQLSAGVVHDEAIGDIPANAIERALGQLLSVLLISLTFGLAAPVISGACTVAAFAQVAHVEYVLHRIGMIPTLDSNSFPSYLNDCALMTRGCRILIFCIVVLVWSVCVIDNLDLYWVSYSIVSVMLLGLVLFIVRSCRSPKNEVANSKSDILIRMVGASGDEQSISQPLWPGGAPGLVSHENEGPESTEETNLT